MTSFVLLVSEYCSHTDNEIGRGFHVHECAFVLCAHVYTSIHVHRGQKSMWDIFYLSTYLFKYLSYISVLPVCMSKSHLHAWCLRGQRRISPVPLGLKLHTDMEIKSSSLNGWLINETWEFISTSFLHLNGASELKAAYLCQIPSPPKWLLSELAAHAFNLPTSH